MASFDSRVAGIPCKIDVVHYLKVPPWKGSAHTCDSDLDYYGYTECDWEVCDRRGKRALWLEKKLTPKDKERIDSEAEAYMDGLNEPDY